MEYRVKRNQKDIDPKMTSGSLWPVGLWGIGILVHTSLHFSNYPLK